MLGHEAGPGQGPVPISGPDGQHRKEVPGPLGSPGPAPRGRTDVRNLPGVRRLEPAALEMADQVSYRVKLLTLQWLKPRLCLTCVDCNPRL